MLLHVGLFWATVILLAALVNGADVAKLRRPAKIASIGGGPYGAASTIGGQSMQQQQPSSGDGVLRLVANVRDEIVDAVEGFTYAETNSERLDHISDLVTRHRGAIGLLSGAWFLKSRILKAASANARASTAFSTSRALEAAKWGTRKATGH
jgi:hypothetical protein